MHNAHDSSSILSHFGGRSASLDLACWRQATGARQITKIYDLGRWMSSSTRIRSQQTPRAQGATGMRTQKVDHVASLLMAGLVVVGLIVSLLFLVWLTQTFTWSAGDIRIEQERVAGRGDHAEGFERDIEPPGAEEVEELAEPTLAETLEAVTDAVTSVAASLDSIDTSSDLSVDGSARGDSRPPGPLGEGDDIVPRFERWELKFQSKGLAALR